MDHGVPNVSRRASSLRRNVVVLRLTWAGGHVAGSGLGGRASVATRPRSLLVPVAACDTARRPVAPVPLSFHVV